MTSMLPQFHKGPWLIMVSFHSLVSFLSFSFFRMKNVSPLDDEMTRTHLVDKTKRSIDLEMLQRIPIKPLNWSQSNPASNLPTNPPTNLQGNLPLNLPDNVPANPPANPPAEVLNSFGMIENQFANLHNYLLPEEGSLQGNYLDFLDDLEEFEQDNFLEMLTEGLGNEFQFNFEPVTQPAEFVSMSVTPTAVPVIPVVPAVSAVSAVPVVPVVPVVPTSRSRTQQTPNPGVVMPSDSLDDSPEVEIGEGFTRKPSAILREILPSLKLKDNEILQLKLAGELS